MAISHIVSNITGKPGRVLISTILYVINLMTFSSLALKDWFQRNAIFQKKSYSAIVAQVIFTGVDAIATITLLALVTGFIFTFRIIAIIDQLGESSEIAELLITTICLGLGPFLAAIIIISRTGSAIVVDLGNMKLHGEIHALENLGININHYLVAPRIIGTAISQLAITVYFTVIALVSGIVISALVLKIKYFQLLLDVSQSFTFDIIILFVVKNLAFGFMIATIACYNGLRVGKSATEVPQRTTDSIVQTLISIFIIEGFLAMAIFA